MAEFHFQNIEIAGMACAVPRARRAVTSFYPRFGKEAVDGFIDMVGVREARVAPEEQTTSDLCFVAAQRLLAHKGVAREKIGAIVFVSQSPDYPVPATACVLQYRLGLPMSCVAYDINLGCSGWVCSMQSVAALMNASDIEYALLLCGDTSVRGGSLADRSTAMLFGDAGSATLLRKNTDALPWQSEIMTDGSGFKAIITYAGNHRLKFTSREPVLWADGNVRSDYDVYINGTDVFAFSIRQAPAMLRRFMEGRAETPADYDAFILHQANLFILKQIAKKAKLPMDKVPLSMDRYGNTSSASIPLTICDYVERGLGKEEMDLLCCGFGVGLSWGIMNLHVRACDMLPVIETDDYFKDGGVSHD